MNPGRVRDAPPVDPPQFAARYLDEFSGKQKLLSNFFGKKAEGVSATPSPRPLSAPSITSLAPVASSSKTVAATTSSTTSLKTASQPALRTPSVPAVKGKGKAKEIEKPEKTPTSGQQSISSFFKPPPKPPKPKPIAKKKKVASTPTAASHPSSSSSSTPSSQPFKTSTTLHPESSIDLTDLPEEEEAPYDWQQDGGDAAMSSAASSSNVDSSSGSGSSAAQWTSLFTPKPVPSCKDHNEPTKLWTVMKPGLNKGRRFYLCSRCAFFSILP